MTRRGQSRYLVPPRCPVRVGAILYDDQVVLASDCHDAIHICYGIIEVNRNDRLGTASYGGSDVVWVNAKSVRKYVDEYWLGSEIMYLHRRCIPRQRGNDDLIAGANFVGTQCALHRDGAIYHERAELGAMMTRKRLANSGSKASNAVQ